MIGKPPAAPEALADSFAARLSLAVLVGAAVGSFATALRTWPAWLLLVPVAISLSWRPAWLPKAVAESTRRLGWLFVAAAVVMGWILMAYPILTTQQLYLWSLVIGYALAVLACLFLLGSSVWNPTWTLFPTTIGTLLVSAFHQEAPIQVFLATAGGALVAFLWLQGKSTLADAKRRQRTPLTQLLSIVLTTSSVFVVAWSIISFLPWAQRRVENTLSDWYVARASGATGLSPHSRLGELAKLKLSRRVALRVWTDRPQKLRGYVLTEFDGRQWSASAPAPVTLLPESEALPLDHASQAWLEELPGDVFQIPEEGTTKDEPIIWTKILRAAASDDVLLSPTGASWIRAPLPELRLRYGRALSAPPPSSASIYGILQSADTKAPPSAPASPEELEKNLATPKDTDPRVRELAKHLSTGSSSPEELVRNTVDYVSSCCQYSLDIGKIRSNQPIAEFLFEKKRGWCEYFASSAALLLRLQGVPTRYVTGFNVIESSKVGGHYLIRDSDAHAWIEAYIPGRGWVAADPTPASEYEALHADLKAGGRINNLLERLRAGLALAWAVFREVDWRRWFSSLADSVVQIATYFFIEHSVIAILIAAVLTLTIVWKLGRFRRHQPAGVLEDRETTSLPPELLTWMDRLDRLWAKQGLPRPGSKAPLEHLMMLPEDCVSAEVRRACGDLIECFYRACFRGEVILPEELKSLRSSMEQALQGNRDDRSLSLK